MRYVVVEPFSDMQDGDFTYKTGDKFPRGGMPTEARLMELSTCNNKLGRVLIKAVDDKPLPPVDTGEVKEPVSLPTEDTEDVEPSVNAPKKPKGKGKAKKGQEEHDAGASS